MNHIFSLFVKEKLYFTVLNIHNFYVCTFQSQEIFVSIKFVLFGLFISKQRENSNRHVISLVIIFHTHNILRNSGAFSIAYFKRPVPLKFLIMTHICMLIHLFCQFYEIHWVLFFIFEYCFEIRLIIKVLN